VPAPRLAHERQRGVGAVQDAEEVHVDHPPPLGRVGALDWPEQHDAGVVDQGVQGAEVLVGVLDERACRALVAHVVGSAIARPPSSSIWAASASIRSPRRAASATAAPAREAARAVASPMPDEAPVIATTDPEMSVSGMPRPYAVGPSVHRPCAR
jgi:hypothetical protein